MRQEESGQETEDRRHYLRDMRQRKVYRRQKNCKGGMRQGKGTGERKQEKAVMRNGETGHETENRSQFE